MKTSNNTILITGGGYGIGFAIAKAFEEKGNRIIIAGRNEERLKKASSSLKNTTAIVCDVTNEQQVDSLVKQVKERFGTLNILVNNAGTANAYLLSATADAYTKAKSEIELNFLSLVRLTEKLLPILEKQAEAAIVNISSIAAHVPLTWLATYSATKAALHSYSQSLRVTLEQTTPNIKVFEVFPPFVDTELAEKVDAPKIKASVVGDDLVAALANEQYEVFNGPAIDMYQLYLKDPVNTVRVKNAVK